MDEIMKASCDLAVDALKTPEIAALDASDANKQSLVDACELACGGSCPSAAEQDRVICLFSLTSRVLP